MFVRVLVLALFASTAVYGQTAPPQPPSLLLPISSSAAVAESTPARERMQALAKRTGVRSQRLVRINREALARLASNPAADGGRLRLELGPGVAVSVRLYEVEKDRLGSLAYRADVEGDPLGSFNLVVYNGIVAGTIDVRGRLFELAYVDGDVVALLERDRSKFVDEGEPIVPKIPKVPPIPKMPPAGRGAVEADNEALINVMVAYTTTASKAEGGTDPMYARISLAMSQLNDAFRDSGAPTATVRAQLTGVIEMGFPELRNSDAELDRLRLDPQIAKFRSSWQADIVSLFVDALEPGTAGRGFIMQTVSTAFASSAFNVVERDAATSQFSFAHEVGHNMGCAHDRANTSSMGAFSYSFGFQSATGIFRTIMAVRSRCPGPGDCPRFLGFSNPFVLRDGEATGVDESSQNAAFNALSLSGTAPTVVQFRTTLGRSTFGNNDLNSAPGFAGIDPGHGNRPRFLADVNADSRADYCRFVGSAPNVFLSCAFATATGFGNHNLTSAAVPAFDPGYDTMPRFMADVNADNRADYCRFVGSAPDIFFSCAFATATGFGNHDLVSGRGPAGFDVGYNTMPQVMADVNADSRADYCRFVGPAANMFLACALAGPSGFGNVDLRSAAVPSFDPGYPTLPQLFADVNADSRADYCRFVGTAPNIFFSCAFASPAGFGNLDFNSTPGLDGGYLNRPIAMADVNADKRADYCRFVGNSPYIFFSCATAGPAAFNGGNDVNSSLNYDAGYDTMFRGMADVNADGKADYCRFVGIAPNVFLSCGFADVSP